MEKEFVMIVPQDFPQLPQSTHPYGFHHIKDGRLRPHFFTHTPVSDPGEH